MNVTSAHGSRAGRSRPLADWTPFFLSFLVPGAGHAYVGCMGRGICWSVAFLAVVLPGMVIAYLVGCDAGATLLIVLPLACLLFCAACGASALRRSRDAGAAARRRRPLWVLEAYAALVSLAAVLELRAFLDGSLTTCTVETSALAPVLERGERCLVVVTKYVRPVHGDVVLLGHEVPGGRSAVGGSPQPGARLARVLAGPGDRVERRDRRLYVNGIEIDLSRTDQQHAIEMAGRKLRQQLVRAIHAVSERTDAAPGLPGSFEWESEAGGAAAILVQSALIVPDASGWEGMPRRALVVHKKDIVGRALR
jgi:hypothetical protein